MAPLLLQVRLLALAVGQTTFSMKVSLLRLAFDRDVEFLTADFNGFGDNETITFTTSNGGNFAITNDNTSVTDDNFDFGTFSLPAGETFTFTATQESAALEEFNMSTLLLLLLFLSQAQLHC